jgi:hypothetical protein
MRQALIDPQLLGGAMPGDSFATWCVFLITRPHGRNVERGGTRGFPPLHRA